MILPVAPDRREAQFDALARVVIDHVGPFAEFPRKDASGLYDCVQILPADETQRSSGPSDCCTLQCCQCSRFGRLVGFLKPVNRYTCASHTHRRRSRKPVSATSISALVADDEPMIALSIEAVLAEVGFEVAMTHSGAEALAALEAGAIHQLLVTDIRLGKGPDGWAIATRARELHPEMQVIYITGDSMDDWRSKGVPDSVLLAKPFLPAQIVSAALSLLNKPEAQTTAN